MTVRYRAFLSYSHQDRAAANWLHHALETYRLPSKLVGLETPAGIVPARLKPIFRDREELSASADLGGAIKAALNDSQFLIVICSPAAAASHWVNEEILNFRRLHGDDRVLALIVAGEPHASASPKAADQECFPPALRLKLNPDGSLAATATEPIAADVRPGADGRRLAKLKLAAAITGLRLDELVQRETQRRVRRLAVIAATASVGMLLSGGLALYANDRRIEANRQRVVAEREAATAQAASDFLVDTFVPANPGVENPRAITALSILGRSARRAHVELAGQPIVQARLISTLGQAYNNLGLPNETRALVERSSSSIRKAGPEGASAQLTLAAAHLQLGSIASAMAALRQAELLLGDDTTKYRDIRASAAITEGIIHTAAGETDAGITAFDRALTIYRSTPSVGLRRLASALVAHGNLLSDDGQFNAAEASLGEALAIHRQILGERHLVTGQNWFALAQNAFLAGNLSLAEKRIAAALSIERQMLDADNPIIADALSMQGQIFHGQGRLLEAERSLEEAIGIYEKAFGGPHYLIGIAQIYLALVESERGRTGKALGILDEAKRNYDASYGKLHANHGDLLVNRATILARAGRRKEAVADCAAGMKILDQTLGPDAAFTKQLGEVCAKI